jgi:hypothetical protein
MYKYFILSIFIILSLYLVKAKQIESLVPQPITVTDTSTESEQNITSSTSYLQTAQAFDAAVYLTDNKINYDYIDNKIDLLTRQYNLIDYNYNNFEFQVGNVLTGTNPNDVPSIVIGGSFPNDIELNFNFPPPKPGAPGDKGETGDQGPQGQTGPMGAQGNRGPFGTCPKK